MTKKPEYVSYRVEVYEPQTKDGYIHPHLLVTQRGPVIALEVDHVRLPVYLDRANLDLLIKQLRERRAQMDALKLARRCGEPRSRRRPRCA